MGCKEEKKGEVKRSGEGLGKPKKEMGRVGMPGIWVQAVAESLWATNLVH
jgi:hypothetical protein